MLCVDCPNYIGREHTVSTTNKMAADYSAYLLSASPPGFDLAYAFPRKNLGLRNKSRNTTKPPKVLHSNTVNSKVSFSCSDENYDQVTEGLSNLLTDYQSSRTKSKSLPLAYTQFQIQHQREVDSNRNVNNNGLKKKCVSFADDLGQELVEIRYMYENSDEPPSFTLPTEMLSSLAQGAQAGITDQPPMMLNFPQPASNYMAFRAKLEKNFVSLENVIVKEYHLLGTIKVKNVAFEKKVVVRYTCDSWATRCDVEGRFVPNIAMSPGTSTSCQYDTFSFQLDIPPTFDPTKKIQFCILYETNGQQFWDSNDDKNYEVVSANELSPPEKTTDNGVFDLHHDDRWAEFSNWSSVDTSVPYW